MSIAQELLDSEIFLINAYDKLAKKGATMPEKKTLKNLAETIESLMGIEFVDYIESTGTQYVDTGFKPNNNTSIEMKVLIPSSQAGNVVRFFESRNNANTVDGAFGILSFDDSNKILQFRYDTAKNSDTNSQLAIDTEYIIRTDKNKLYVNDTLKVEQTTSTFQLNYNLLLFGYQSPSDLHSNTGVYRLYYFKIYDNGVLIRDFKPCKNTHGECCLYDAVSNRYFYNAGSGIFNCG